MRKFHVINELTFIELYLNKKKLFYYSEILDESYDVNSLIHLSQI